MKRAILGVIAVSVFVSYAQPAVAVDPLEFGMTSARQALERQQYKKAELALKKALNKTPDAPDSVRASANVLLATVYRQAGKITDAAQALKDAHDAFKNLGHVDQAYADEFNELNKVFRMIDVPVLGATADALVKNGATISMAKSELGAHVEINMPSAYENTLNNPKVDGLQLAPVVAFDIESNSPDDIHVWNIKGFKIHSVEKNTWANLLELKIGAIDQEGKYDAEITAGKGGFTKKVPSKLPFKAYEPVSAIAKQLIQFSAPGPALDLPVISAGPASTSLSSSGSSSSATSETSGETKVVSPEHSAAAEPAKIDKPAGATAISEPAQPGVIVVPKSSENRPSAGTTGSGAFAADGGGSSGAPPAAPGTNGSGGGTGTQPVQSERNESAAAGNDDAKERDNKRHEGTPSDSNKKEKQKVTEESSKEKSKPAPAAKTKKHDDDDDDDDDDDEKEDDHAILHGVQKLIRSIGGKE